MPVVIRDASLTDPRDAAAIVAMVNAYALDPLGGGKQLPDDVRARLVPGLRAHPTSLVLLAWLDDQPVGVAVCFWGFSTFQARPLVNVHDLAVLPDHRGAGIGRALLAGVEERARARGCCKLTLEVLDENARARGLYVSFGFTDGAFGDSSSNATLRSTSTRFLTKPLPGGDR